MHLLATMFLCTSENTWSDKYSWRKGALCLSNSISHQHWSESHWKELRDQYLPSWQIHDLLFTSKKRHEKNLISRQTWWNQARIVEGSLNFTQGLILIDASGSFHHDVFANPQGFDSDLSVEWGGREDKDQVHVLFEEDVVCSGTGLITRAISFTFSLFLFSIDLHGG